MKLFGMCIDKRVVAGVAISVALLWWLAPGLVATALPFLLFAICPLSMLLMMKAMNQMGAKDTTQPEATPSTAEISDPDLRS